MRASSSHPFHMLSSIESGKRPLDASGESGQIERFWSPLRKDLPHATASLRNCKFSRAAPVVTEFSVHSCVQQPEPGEPVSVAACIEIRPEVCLSLAGHLTSTGFRLKAGCLHSISHMDFSGGSSITAYRTKSQTLSLAASSSETAVHGSTTPHTPQRSRQPIAGLSSAPQHLKRPASPQRASAATFQAPAAEQALQPDQLSESFEDMILASDEAILVDFYAPWCGPCELMSRVILKLSNEMKGELKVVKVNTDNYPKLASKYRIQALPTCLLFRDGALIDRVNGYMPESSFGRRVRFYVAKLDKKFGRR